VKEKFAKVAVEKEKLPGGTTIYYVPKDKSTINLTTRVPSRLQNNPDGYGIYIRLAKQANAKNAPDAVKKITKSLLKAIKSGMMYPDEMAIIRRAKWPGTKKTIFPRRTLEDILTKTQTAYRKGSL
jgi:hypothetical protein